MQNNTCAYLLLCKKIESLQSEINILKTLKHENIVRYLDSEKTNETFSIFLEYIEG
jgi:serine/threonine protein kinase